MIMIQGFVALFVFLPLLLKAVCTGETCDDHHIGLRTFNLYGASLKQIEGVVLF